MTTTPGTEDFAADARPASHAPTIPPAIRRKARFALVWERLWRAGWAVTALVVGFVALAWTDWLPAVPAVLHGAVLVLFVAALVWMVRRARAAWQPVSDDDVRARIERDSGFTHRPLVALTDTLAGGSSDSTAQALWAAHKARMKALAAGMRVNAPAPRVPATDRWGLRAFAVLGLAVGIAAGGLNDPGGRLMRALVPFDPGPPAPPPTIEGWITPPEYTRLQPRFLKADATTDEAVRVPAGSKLLVQVAGASRPPELLIDSTSFNFDSLAEGQAVASHRIERVLTAGTRLAVRYRGREAAAWPVQVVADAAPSVVFTEPPKEEAGAQLLLAYKAEDDYGIAKLELHLQRPDGVPLPDGTTRSVEVVPMPGLNPVKASGRTQRDLTAHPWAGRTVRLSLVATDSQGQAGGTDWIELQLPERQFRHPVARALAAERKRLFDPNADARSAVAATLHMLGKVPESYDNNLVVHLAMTVAKYRLLMDNSVEGLMSAANLMWNTALRLDQGQPLVAERELNAAQERLMEAMRPGADPAEIERLMAEMQRLLNEFFNAMVQQMMEMGVTDMPMMPPPPGEQLSTSDMQQMMDRARELARTGNMEAARQMMAELQRMLESVRQALAQGMSPRQQQANREAQQAMREMNDLAQRQQRLLDRTFRRNQQQMQNGQRPPAEPQQGEPMPSQEEDAAEQEAIRKALGDLMMKMDNMLGQIPEGMGRAERAMRGAGQALQQGSPGEAVPLQTEALEALRQGGQQAAQQMMQQGGNQFGFGVGPAPGGQQSGMRRNPTRDPFGRRLEERQGGAMEGDLEVPDEMEVQRSREILDELRRRSGQRGRPAFEQEYIERLMRQF